MIYIWTQFIFKRCFIKDLKYQDQHEPKKFSNIFIKIYALNLNSKRLNQSR